MEKLMLSAYQNVTFESTDLGDQFTESGIEPRTMRLRLTTAMDEQFINRTVTALLTEADQRNIIERLQANLDGTDL
jgi:hypothetical protein